MAEYQYCPPPHGCMHAARKSGPPTTNSHCRRLTLIDQRCRCRGVEEVRAVEQSPSRAVRNNHSAVCLFELGDHHASSWRAVVHTMRKSVLTMCAWQYDERSTLGRVRWVQRNPHADVVCELQPGSRHCRQLRWVSVCAILRSHHDPCILMPAVDAHHVSSGGCTAYHKEQPRTSSVRRLVALHRGSHTRSA